MTTGYIYALSNGHMPGLLKIGVTERTPEDRAKELFTTGVPSRFKVELKVRVKDPHKKEKIIHQLLEMDRLPSREFFQVELSKVKDLFYLMDSDTIDALDAEKARIPYDYEDADRDAMENWIEQETEESETSESTETEEENEDFKPF